MRYAISALPLAIAVTFACPSGAQADLFTPPWPQPTGPYSVGTTDAYFEDAGRMNTIHWDPNRSIATTVWYPTDVTDGARAKLLSNNPVNDALMATRIAEVWRSPGVANQLADRTTASFYNAPVKTDLGQLPVVVWQPGMGNPRSMGTSLAEDLASHGYVVIAIDPPDSPIVQYADGVADNPISIEVRNPDWMNRDLKTRVLDTIAVIDKLAELPLGLNEIVDESRIGATGHSYGGYSAMAAAYEDDRIDAAMVIDGTVSAPGTDTPKPGSVATDGLDVPSMLLSAVDGGVTWPEWQQFQQATRAWFGEVTIEGALHHAFTDACQLAIQLCGAIAPALALDVTRMYVRSFFLQFLNGVAQPVLDHLTRTNGIGR